jgi:hypothetical protein
MCCISLPSVSLCCHSNSLERRGERERFGWSVAGWREKRRS